MTRKRETYEAPQVGAAARRMMRALVRRAGDGEAEAIEQLVELERAIGGILADAVAAHRQGPAAASWTTIAELTGTSRQAAHRRFGSERCSHGRTLAARRDNACPTGLVDCEVAS